MVPFPQNRSVYSAKHMVEQAEHRGNPRFYSTYWDESLNKVFTSIAATTRRATMQRRLFAKYKGWTAYNSPAFFCFF